MCYNNHWRHFLNVKIKKCFTFIQKVQLGIGLENPLWLTHKKWVDENDKCLSIKLKVNNNGM